MGITFTFRVPIENDIGRKVADFCAERWVCVGNIYFKHKSLHKYTRVARGQNRVEVISMIDLVLVKKDMLCYVQDVRTVRGIEIRLSNNYFVLGKARLVDVLVYNK